MLLVDAGLFLLGLVLLIAGWVMTPAASFVFPGPIDTAGQSLIALGLAFVVVSVGLLLAGLEERMMPKMD
jgi:hypothetical protein